MFDELATICGGDALSHGCAEMGRFINQPQRSILYQMFRIHPGVGGDL